MMRTRWWSTLTIRIGLGTWLLFASLVLLGYPPAIRGFARTGYADWVRLVLGGTEALAALLFLLPRIWRTGAWALLAVLAAALGLHLARHQFPIILLVYACGVGLTLGESPGQRRNGYE